MASSTHNPTVLLKRLLTLKEPSPLYFITDTLAQTAKNSILDEFKFQRPNDLDIVYVSFETLNKPSYATEFIIASQFFQSFQKLLSTIQEKIEIVKTKNPRSLVLCVIDNIGYIDKLNVASMVQSLAGPRITLCVILHRDNLEIEEKIHNREMPSTNLLGQNLYPTTYNLLKFIATNVFEIYPSVTTNKHIDDDEELDSMISKFHVPRGLNNKNTYEVHLTNRRKSGRSLHFDFIINSETHEYTHKVEIANSGDTTEPSFDGLTTFNLGTTNKQKIAREQVDLPFLEAQSFNTGGAIVYEFEKDDDYDEEDPYEDPF